MGQLLLRRQHHDHLPPFHLRPLLDNPIRIQICPHALQQLDAEFLVGHFTAPKTQRDLRLVALIQKSDQITQLDLVVASSVPGRNLISFTWICFCFSLAS